MEPEIYVSRMRSSTRIRNGLGAGKYLHAVMPSYRISDSPKNSTVDLSMDPWSGTVVSEIPGARTATPAGGGVRVPPKVCSRWPASCASSLSTCTQGPGTE